MDTEAGVMVCKARDAKNCQQLPEVGERLGMVSPSEPPEGSANTCIQASGLLKTVENTFLLFYHPVWSLVTAALGNKHRDLLGRCPRAPWPRPPLFLLTVD